MKKTRLKQLRGLYFTELMENVIPFWMKYSLDRKYGGYLHCLDRYGKPYTDDKYMWMQARGLWIFSKLYNTIERNKEWLHAAQLGYDFIKKYGFSQEGRLYFGVTRDGKPLFKPWHIYTETFCIIGMVEYYRATGRKDVLEEATELYCRITQRLNRGDIESNTYPNTRYLKAHAISLIMLGTTYELSKVHRDSKYSEMIEGYLHEILYKFYKPDKKALFEYINTDDSLHDSPDGRTINPGHAIESAWFILQYLRENPDKERIERTVGIIENSLTLGWDNKYGGLFYFIDYESKPNPSLEWDMKLWWVHCETLYGLLLGYHLTGKKSLFEWYEKVHDWTFSHFPDREYGEWYGYLHRDGSVSHDFKGSVWKGPFHLPRFLLLGYELLGEML